MNTRRPRYHRHRFPPEIISHAVWLYHRYCMSFRDVEDLLAERGIIVSYETIRQWCGKFGPDYARQLKRRQGRLGDTWFLDEVFVTINGQRQYLWRAVDQDDDLIDILVQPRRDGRAARRFFRRLLKSQRQEPVRLVTDKLGSYRVAHRDLMPLVTHDTRRYANNRAEVSHQPTRQRERQMRGFTSSDHPTSPLVFHRDGIPVRRWRTAWRTACQAAGVPTRFLHDCRRTAARNLIRASVPERVAMLLTGHKSRAIFDRYNIIHEQELLDAGDQLVAYLAQQAPAAPARRRPHAVGPAAPLRLVRRGTA